MSGVRSVPARRNWLAQLLSGAPHQVVGPPEAPYLNRWFLARTRWGNVYLHQFLKSDDPDALHDHPWAFASVCLRRGYVEVTESGRRARRAGSIAVRPARFRHRIELVAPVAEGGRACWTVVATGTKTRSWGFWCPGGRFVPWTDFDGGCGEGR